MVQESEVSAMLFYEYYRSSHSSKFPRKNITSFSKVYIRNLYKTYSNCDITVFPCLNNVLLGILSEMSPTLRIKLYTLGTQ